MSVLRSLKSISGQMIKIHWNSFEFPGWVEIEFVFRNAIYILGDFMNALCHLLSLSYYYASTSLSCTGIQQWKSVLFSCWASINLVGEMSNEEQDTPPPTLPTLFLTVKSSASLVALGGKSLKRDRTWRNIEIHS